MTNVNKKIEITKILKITKNMEKITNITKNTKQPFPSSFVLGEDFNMRQCGGLRESSAEKEG